MLNPQLAVIAEKDPSRFMKLQSRLLSTHAEQSLLGSTSSSTCLISSSSTYSKGMTPTTTPAAGGAQNVTPIVLSSSTSSHTTVGGGKGGNGIQGSGTSSDQGSSTVHQQQQQQSEWFSVPPRARQWSSAKSHHSCNWYRSPGPSPYPHAGVAFAAAASHALDLMYELPTSQHALLLLLLAADSNSFNGQLMVVMAGRAEQLMQQPQAGPEGLGLAPVGLLGQQAASAATLGWYLGSCWGWPQAVGKGGSSSSCISGGAVGGGGGGDVTRRVLLGGGVRPGDLESAVGFLGHFQSPSHILGRSVTSPGAISPAAAEKAAQWGRAGRTPQTSESQADGNCFADGWSNNQQHHIMTSGLTGAETTCNPPCCREVPLQPPFDLLGLLDSCCCSIISRHGSSSSAWGLAIALPFLVSYTKAAAAQQPHLLVSRAIQELQAWVRGIADDPGFSPLNPNFCQLTVCLKSCLDQLLMVLGLPQRVSTFGSIPLMGTSALSTAGTPRGPAPTVGRSGDESAMHTPRTSAPGQHFTPKSNKQPSGGKSASGVAAGHAHTIAAGGPESSHDSGQGIIRSQPKRDGAWGNSQLVSGISRGDRAGSSHVPPLPRPRFVSTSSVPVSSAEEDEVGGQSRSAVGVGGQRLGVWSTANVSCNSLQKSPGAAALTVPAAAEGGATAAGERAGRPISSSLAGSSGAGEDSIVGKSPANAQEHTNGYSSAPEQLQEQQQESSTLSAHDVKGVWGTPPISKKLWQSPLGGQTKLGLGAGVGNRQQQQQQQQHRKETCSLRNQDCEHQGQCHPSNGMRYCTFSILGKEEEHQQRCSQQRQQQESDLTVEQNALPLLEQQWQESPSGRFASRSAAKPALPSPPSPPHMANGHGAPSVPVDNPACTVSTLGQLLQQSSGLVDDLYWQLTCPQIVATVQQLGDMSSVSQEQQQVQSRQRGAKGRPGQNGPVPAHSLDAGLPAESAVVGRKQGGGTGYSAVSRSLETKPSAGVYAATGAAAAGRTAEGARQHAVAAEAGDGPAKVGRSRHASAVLVALKSGVAEPGAVPRSLEVALAAAGDEVEMQLQQAFLARYSTEEEQVRGSGDMTA